MQDYDEKRIGPRVPVDCEVRFTVKGETDQHQGVCKDLSVDGLAFETDYQAETGQELEINLVPPEGTAVPTLRAFVEVVRVTPAGSGSGCRVAGAIKEILQ
jgi:hypothetical protein